MAHADSENGQWRGRGGLGVEEVGHVCDCLGAVKGIAGAIGEKETVVEVSNGGHWGIPRQCSDFDVQACKTANDILLCAKVEQCDFKRCTWVEYSGRLGRDSGDHVETFIVREREIFFAFQGDASEG